MRFCRLNKERLKPHMKRTKEASSLANQHPSIVRRLPQRHPLHIHTALAADEEGGGHGPTRCVYTDPEELKLRWHRV